MLRARGLGDLCAAVPALRALRRSLPHRIVLAAPLELAPLVALAGIADELAPQRSLDAPLCRRLAGVDLAIDLHGPGPESGEALERLAPRRAVGFGLEGAPRWDPDEPERHRWCRLVREAMAVPADPWDLRIEPHATWAEHPERVVVHPGAASAARRWPVERYAEVVRHLVDAGLDVTVTGDPDERELAEVLAALLPDHLRSHLRIATGRTDVAGLCRIVAEARIVICGDTGVAHLATAFGRPSVLLFGPTDPRRWGPPADPAHRVLWAGTTGDPHATRPDPGLLQIETVDVLEAVDAQLAEASPWSWSSGAR
ncbi:MAG TPA: glycosyltransferase family 9 protein [Aquihabitans sp.]|nr:glycosyltransferase family 9 protein [Aquihabitans sp.]